MTSIDRFVHAVRRNPEGLLLVGAGVALVLRGAMVPSAATRARSNENTAHDAPTSMEEIQSSVGKALRKGVSEMQGAVAGTAQDLGERASNMGQAAANGAMRAAGDARSSVEDIVEAQPISVAIAGIVVGCLAAAFLPTSRLEKETLRPIGNQAVDALANAGERFKDATISAGEQLREAAADRGLNKSGVSEVARDVASEFKSNVMGGTVKSSESSSYGR